MPPKRAPKNKKVKKNESAEAGLDATENRRSGEQSSEPRVDALDTSKNRRSGEQASVPRSGSDSENELENENARLVKKCDKQQETIKKYKRRLDEKDMETAELKDLVVHAVGEAKAAKEGTNTDKTFKAAEDLGITSDQVEQINAVSKNVGVFAQNLALHIYGAEELSKRSVTGRNYNGKPGFIPKPTISPSKLDFIYNAAKDRVAMKVGARNHSQIDTLAQKSTINRALAEKIGNLNRSRRFAAQRNALAECDKQ